MNPWIVVAPGRLVVDSHAAAFTSGNQSRRPTRSVDLPLRLDAATVDQKQRDRQAAYGGARDKIVRSVV
jgi:hypothetical protein